MTTMTVDITGFEDVLNQSFQFQLTFNETRGLTGPTTPEAYLQDLVTRQLEGLRQAGTRIPSDAELQLARNSGLRARNSTIDKLGR